MRATSFSLESADSHSSVRRRQLSHLNSQLAQLHANLCDFKDLITVTSAQYNAIEKIGKIHGSFFMASHAVFESDTFNEPQESD
ncbi:uncharacterized protein PRCAT00001364001 [Priceomyces carsonii]|uniref:uncharacterized protein n=1 Tax=Priceomyces carsonii TaxID=28549 RepID=UPI002ED77EC8|nr:unnamed protein product [Priceomyces carsonii]